MTNSWCTMKMYNYDAHMSNTNLKCHSIAYRPETGAPVAEMLNLLVSLLFAVLFSILQ